MTELRAREPLTLPEILAMKPAGTKIVMVTAYDHPSARLASEAGVDLILVGDSAGEQRPRLRLDGAGDDGRGGDAHRGRGARASRARWSSATCRSASFQPSDAQAVRNAVRFVKAGADAVKLEGAGPMVSRVARDRRRRDPGHGPPRA